LKTFGSLRHGFYMWVWWILLTVCVFNVILYAFMIAYVTDTLWL